MENEIERMRVLDEESRGERKEEEEDINSELV